MNFRPVCDCVDVGFAAVPRQRSRVPDHRSREATHVGGVEVNRRGAAGEGIQINASDTGEVLQAIVRVMRNISIVTHAYASLRKQSGRERVRMIQCAALDVLVTGALEASAFRASRYA